MLLHRPFGKLKSGLTLKGPLCTILTRSASKMCAGHRAGSVGGGTYVSTMSLADGLSVTGLTLRVVEGWVVSVPELVVDGCWPGLGATAESAEIGG